MNKQVNYIVSAFLILVVAGLCFLFISKISSLRDGREVGVTTIDNNIHNQTSTGSSKCKALFMAKCAACHAIFKDMTGPSLVSFTKKGPWVIRQNVYDWLRNPEAFMKKNEYVKELRQSFGGTMMQAFPNISYEEIDAICDYIEQANRPQNMPVAFKG
jgi:cytochrome c